ncbi:MAG: hypothetical protein ACK4K9_06370 [Bacteroidia bacterium]
MKKVFYAFIFVIFVFTRVNALNEIEEIVPKQIFGLSNTHQSNFSLSSWRVGFGTGVAFYMGDQRYLTKITTKFGPFTEFRPSFVAEIFKVYNQRVEFGLRYINGQSETLKSENTLGVQNKFQDLQFNVQYSFNRNIAMNRSRFTFNGQAGLGLITFQSKFIGVDPILKKQNYLYSAVGYGNQYSDILPTNKNIPNKPIVPIGNLGINLGYRIAPFLSIYWQNNLSLAPTYYLSGNLYKWSILPPDGYFYTGFLVSINFGQASNGGARNYGKYKCPKF